MSANEAIALILVIGVIGFVLVTNLRALLDHMRKTKSEKLQSEVYNKMLDKLGSSQDVLAWLQTDAGQNLFKVAPPDRPAPYSRILNSVQFGVVALVLGGGILAIRTMIGVEGQEPAAVVGTLVMALGLGMLLAGACSYALSKKFQLFNGGGGK